MEQFQVRNDIRSQFHDFYCIFPNFQELIPHVINHTCSRISCIGEGFTMIFVIFHFEVKE